MRRSKCNLVLASAAFFSLGLSSGSFAQNSLETKFRITGEMVTGVFEKQREVIQASSAVIYDKRDEISYGVVIGVDGFILTKLSEIEGAEDLSVRVGKNKFTGVEILDKDLIWDVALLKVDATDLQPPVFAETSDLPQGSWVVVNGATSRSKRRILAGVISANPREVKTDGGAVLGVAMEIKEGKLVVAAVVEDSGAEAAGVKVGDTIIKVGEEEVSSFKEVTDLLAEEKAGSKVEISILREEKELKLEVELAAKGEVFELTDRNDQMSGNFSKRRSGFPRIIQHDVLGNANSMGGPVIGLDGKLIGMNIARANRAETFAIPVEQVKELAENFLEKHRE